MRLLNSSSTVLSLCLVDYSIKLLTRVKTAPLSGTRPYFGFPIITGTKGNFRDKTEGVVVRSAFWLADFGKVGTESLCAAAAIFLCGLREIYEGTFAKVDLADRALTNAFAPS